MRFSELLTRLNQAVVETPTSAKYWVAVKANQILKEDPGLQREKLRVFASVGQRGIILAAEVGQDHPLYPGDRIYKGSFILNLVVKRRKALNPITCKTEMFVERVELGDNIWNDVEIADAANGALLKNAVAAMQRDVGQMLKADAMMRATGLADSDIYFISSAIQKRAIALKPGVGMDSRRDAYLKHAKKIQDYLESQGQPRSKELDIYLKTEGDEPD